MGWWWRGCANALSPYAPGPHTLSRPFFFYLQDGQGERAGLAGPGLGEADDVLAWKGDKGRQRKNRGESRLSARARRNVSGRRCARARPLPPSRPASAPPHAHSTPPGLTRPMQALPPTFIPIHSPHLATRTAPPAPGSRWARTSRARPPRRRAGGTRPGPKTPRTRATGRAPGRAGRWRGWWRPSWWVGVGGRAGGGRRQAWPRGREGGRECCGPLLKFCEWPARHSCVRAAPLSPRTPPGTPYPARHPPALSERTRRPRPSTRLPAAGWRACPPPPLGIARAHC